MDAHQYITIILQNKDPKALLQDLLALSPEQIVSIRSHIGHVDFQQQQIIIPRSYSAYPLASMLFFSILLWSGDLDEVENLDLSGYGWLQTNFPGFTRLHASCLDSSIDRLHALDNALESIEPGVADKLFGDNSKMSLQDLANIFNKCSTKGKLNSVTESRTKH